MMNKSINKSLLASCLAVSYTSGVWSFDYDPLAEISPVPGVSFERVQGIPYRTKTEDLKTPHHHRMKPVRHAWPGSKSAAAILGTHQRQLDQDEPAYQNVTPSNSYGMTYSLSVTVGNTPMDLILDTGSADTWVIKNGFDCIDFTGTSIDPPNCGFGPTYSDGYQYGLTPDEVHMFVRYGDGEMAIGDMGYSDITLAGLTVKKQQISIANQTFWYGDNHTSGMIGLGYPSMTNAYYGDWFESAPYNQAEYPPIFTNMWQQGVIEPMFSLALMRNSSESIIGWGGIPTVMSGLDYSTAATADLIVTNLNGNPWASMDYSFYTIIPEGFVYGVVSDFTKYPFIIDSGTSLLYLPERLADAINAAFQPPARYMWELGAYFTSCDAVAPRLAIRIGGVDFTVNPRDLIFRDLVEPMSGKCMTAIGSGGTGPFILGSALLYNVLAIFDVGNAEMRFLGRPYY